MSNVGDDILHNILARLPGKPLLRFRCVSKHWNGLISDPYFMKSRSRRMILLPFPRPLVALDDNVPVEDEAHSMVRIHFPFEYTRMYIVGTLNGIVLLALYDTFMACQLILYNPLTCVSKVLVTDPTCKDPYVFGFGYGASTDDLKIVRFEAFRNENNVPMYKCDAFDLKTNSWSTPPQYYIQYFHFGGAAGVFINGFLYWSFYYPYFGILALNVKDMVSSTIYVPGTRAGLLLGSLDGYLCMVNNVTGSFTFDVWLMKEEGVWLKARSFRFGSEGNVFYPVCILGDGKILIKSSTQLVICDASKDSYKVLNGLATLGNFSRIDRVLHREYYPLMYSRSIEYVESLVSPSDMCSI
ncbi:putative F-box domain-containing protein [Helianthus annuus]|uniref:F-box protein CPR1 n=1 Tax=Helianthus annuus TaxID=4232 RepID=UPI000B906C4F|nr:F-box protein CPR1 [Helianthus annuus]KAJ0465463.1 putative F-box domain-containing protein [Helianthus annuus]KAJ0470292.1 putative F-box domain-containing protein [Helianthus annuus]KAJ0487060.1 putative F-box domain-containing protein [Helianthus annuus]KAJ0661183.1 putative F-box domain-containing protein [Helianthus annuus]KAJ0855311.1 putative F-box domain-containing protein [Helianthus annuus]